MRKETEKRYEIYREGREEGKGKGVWKRCSTGLSYAWKNKKHIQGRWDKSLDKKRERAERVSGDGGVFV